jgi:multidrug resistance protein MdtO
MMWLAYDRLWSSPAGVEMKRSFVSALRLLAQFAREPVSDDIAVATERNYALREIINTQFDKVRSLADAVLFEFGSSRQRDLRLRDHIRRWQPELRALFVMRIASWKYRVNLPGFELPEAVRIAQQEYDDRSGAILENLADRIEDDRQRSRPISGGSSELLEQMLEELSGEEERHTAASHVGSLMTMLLGIDGLMRSLTEEITMEFDGAR